MSLPRFERGQVLKAEDLQRLVDAVVARIGGGANSLVRRSGNNVVLDAVPDFSRTPRQVLFFKVVNPEADDVITCHHYNPATGITGAANIVVAKPWAFRLTPFHGNSVTYYNGGTFSFSYSDYATRVATNGDGETQTQILTPDYWAGEVIRAVRGDTGLTYGANNAHVVWEDLNLAGRYWAEEPA